MSDLSSCYVHAFFSHFETFFHYIVYVRPHVEKWEGGISVVHMSAGEKGDEYCTNPMCE